MATVDISGVEKVYPNGFKAIHGIDIAIADGELIVLVGPSGCGKSTLLRMVAGLEGISAGEVAIGGTVVNALEPAARNIAMVFQNYALYPHMSVRDNMAYGLRNRQTPKDEIDRRVAEAAEILELAELLDRKPRQLSGGQRQRVAMGRAIVRDPAAFLFDEPLSNLDAKLRVQMRLEIKRLQRKLGTTSLYVTHDQVEAMTLADRLVLMNAGIAEQIGSPMELYDRPATMFVAGFIGSPAMNFLPGRITTEGRLAIGEVELALGNGHAAMAGREVAVGMRPEHLTLPAAGEAADLTLHVELVEALGADTLVHGVLAAHSQPLTVRLGGHRSFAMGEALPLSVTTEHVHLFDPQSERRID